jgi:hypothetical protein
MRTQPDELAFWLPTKAAFLALGDVLTPRQQQKLHANLLGLAQHRVEKNDLKTANFLWELAGHDPAEEEPKAEKQKPTIILAIDNTKP